MVELVPVVTLLVILLTPCLVAIESFDYVCDIHLSHAWSLQRV